MKYLLCEIAVMFHISSEKVSNSTVSLRTYYSAEGFRDFTRLLRANY